MHRDGERWDIFFLSILDVDLFYAIYSMFILVLKRAEIQVRFYANQEIFIYKKLFSKLDNTGANSL